MFQVRSVEQTFSNAAPKRRPTYSPSIESTLETAAACAEIINFELTGDFDLVSEPIVFISMSSIRNWYQI